MNLMLMGGAFLGILMLSPVVLKTPIEATVAQDAKKIAASAADDTEQRGWMTREINVDPETGETTETNIIGFAD